MLLINTRIVDNFEVNKKFYCDKLGFEATEAINDNKEKLLILKYEENFIEFILRKSIKDVRKYLEDKRELEMFIEVESYQNEFAKARENDIKIINFNDETKEFTFLDCNGFLVKVVGFDIGSIFLNL